MKRLWPPFAIGLVSHGLGWAADPECKGVEWAAGTIVRLKAPHSSVITGADRCSCADGRAPRPCLDR